MREDSLFYDVMFAKNSRVAKWLLQFFQAEPTWDNLTAVNLKRFNAYLHEHLSANTVKNYIAELRAVINLYKDQRDIPITDKNMKSVLKTKSVRSTHCYLTIEELEKFEDLENLNPTQRDVRDMFLLQAWTGCRLSDAITLTEENISGDMLTYTSQKTQIYASVPLKPVVRDIISRIPQIKIHNKMTYNRNVHQLCKMAGITQPTMVWQSGKKVTEPKCELISSHSARRSFATNLYEAGIEINKISYMMGHTNTAMTERYICSNMEMGEEIREFFK
jgi:integrase